MTQNKSNMTFELKHGYYAIIKEGIRFIQLDTPAETFEKALVFAYETTKTLPNAEVVHLGNYDVERKMKEGK